VHIHWLGDEACHATIAVGGKAATLSRFAADHRVPPGFALPARSAAGFREATCPAPVADGVRNAYAMLAEIRGEPDPPVAVRSSAIDEDGAAASFAGQHQTYLNVRGAEAVLECIGRCVRSAASDEALAYRRRHGLETESPAIAVLVQALVPSDVSAVVFSANPVSGNRGEVVINASWGLGESIVGGTVTPDTYVVARDGLVVTGRHLGNKARMTVLDANGTREVAVPRILQAAPALDDAHAVAMARLALALEERAGVHVDVECALSRGELYLLQCRPITTLATR
jgi:pyruvate,water dikinase